MTMPKSATPSPCECGCGEMTAPGRRFRTGHNSAAPREVREVDGEQCLLCPRCGEWKPLDGFPRKGKTRRGDQRYGYCKPCHSAYQRAHTLRREYGIDEHDYETILAAQGGGCAICGRKPGATRLAIDHCHESGWIRGLLCGLCNGVLGRWADDAQRFARAAEYLGDPPAPHALGRVASGWLTAEWAEAAADYIDRALDVRV